MKSVEKFIIIALIALGISKLITFGSPWLTRYILLNGADPQTIVGIQALFSLMALIVFNVVIGAWTYKEAKKQETSAVLWFFLSLFLGVLGLILFYTYFSYRDRVRQQSVSRGV